MKTNTIDRNQKFNIFNYAKEKQKIEVAEKPPFSLTDVKKLYERYKKGTIDLKTLKESIINWTYALEEHVMNKLYNKTLVISEWFEKSERSNIQNKIKTRLNKFIDLEINFIQSK